MKILVGRFDNPNLGSHNAPSNVEVKINKYPFCTNCTVAYTIQRIPSNNVAYSIPLIEPLTTYTGNVTFTADSATIILNNFIDGDAYILYINPSTVLSISDFEQPVNNSSIFIYPNPANNILTINLNDNQKTSLQLVNTLGIILKEIQIKQTGQVDISNLPSGVYMIRNPENHEQILRFIKE